MAAQRPYLVHTGSREKQALTRLKMDEIFISFFKNVDKREKKFYKLNNLVYNGIASLYIIKRGRCFRTVFGVFFFWARVAGPLSDGFF